MADKKYLFILQNEKTDIDIETYTTDEKGTCLTEKASVVPMPNIGIDARVALVEAAIKEKIRFHHKLETNEFTLVEKVEKIFDELLNKTNDSSITIRFEAAGRPTAENYVLFIKEDKDINFSFKQMTKDAYQTLKNRIEIPVKGPLSIFDKIYVFDGLLSQNRLFNGLIEEFGDKKITTDSSNSSSQKDKLIGLKVRTLEERAEIERLEKTALEEKNETDNYENLATEWDSTTVTLRDKINHSQTFLTNFPNSKRKSKVDGKILSFQDNEAWEKADDDKSVESYTNYLNQFKEGISKEEAKKCIADIRKSEEKKVETTALTIGKLEKDNKILKEKGQKEKRRFLVAASIVAVLVVGFGISRLIIPPPTESVKPPLIIKTVNTGETLSPTMNGNVMKDRINCTLKSISDSLKLNDLESSVRTKLYADEIKFKDVLDVPVEDYQKTLTIMGVTIHSKCK